MFQHEVLNYKVKHTQKDKLIGFLPRHSTLVLFLQERDDYGALVETLGGIMSDAPHYDASCSHLVVGTCTPHTHRTTFGVQLV